MSRKLLQFIGIELACALAVFFVWRFTSGVSGEAFTVRGANVVYIAGATILLKEISADEEKQVIKRKCELICEYERQMNVSLADATLYEARNNASGEMLEREFFDLVSSIHNKGRFVSGTADGTGHFSFIVPPGSYVI